MVRNREKVTKLFFIFAVLAALAFQTVSLNRTAVQGDSSPPALFNDIAAPSDFEPDSNPAISRTRFVTVNFDLFSDPESNNSLLLNLFDDTSYVAVLDRSVGRSPGHVTWIGHIEGSGDSQVTLVAKNNEVLVGNISSVDGKYEVRFAADGVHVINEIDELGLPPHAEPIEVNPTEAGETFAAASTAAEAGADDGSQIDIMVVYTPAARSAAGGVLAMEALIDLAVEETNTAFANSLISPRLRLVHSAEVNYVETGDMELDLPRLRSKTDGYMDEVHAWRDTYNADQVSLIEASGNSCGIAYLMNSVSSSFAPWAFSVVHRSCATGNLTFGHELGHNLGSHHDRLNSGSTPAYPYSYGYHAPDRAFRTVMAYNCVGGCPRIQAFSNPNVLSGGQPIGIDYEADPSNSADNTRSINNVAYIFSNFRFSGDAPTEPPQAPTGLTATVVSDTQINLAWTDNAANESGFEIEGSSDGSAWAQIALVGTNGVSFSNTQLEASTDYHYRVRAYNAVGTSGYAGPVMDTTDDPPPFVDDVAQSETPVAGSVSGSYTNTWSDNGVSQTITERHSGGKRANRHSYLEHRWVFNVRGGNSVTLFLNASASDSGEGDDFVFAYSTNGSSYTDMLTIQAGYAGGAEATFPLPSGTSGTVYVRVMDTDQTKGKSQADSISVEHLYIRSDIDGEAPPPATPDLLTATAASASQIDLTWSHDSGAEYGYEIERSLDGETWTPAGTAGAGASSYSDNGLSPNTEYWHRLHAFNGAGDSGDSNKLSATTFEGSDIVLSATGYKVKGVQHADLSWTGNSSTTIKIYRDGVLVTEILTGEAEATSQAYTDNINKKGGGNYQYQLCVDASTPGAAAECSNFAAVVF